MRRRAVRASDGVHWRGGRIARATCASAALLALGSVGPVPALRAAGPPPIIPRALLFSEPQRLRPTLSPDGATLAFLAPSQGGGLNVWVAPVEDPAAARPLTSAPGGVRGYVWAYTSKHILFMQESEDEESLHVFSAALDGGEPIDLTPFSGVHARIQQRSPRQPNQVLLAVSSGGGIGADLHRVDVRTGAREIVQTNEEGFAAFVTDDRLRVRFAVRFTDDGGQEVLQPAEDGGWTLFTRVPAEDALTTAPIGFSEDGSLLYMYDSRGRDTVAITVTNVLTGERALLVDFDGADVDGVLIHPASKRIQAASFTRARRAWHALDPDVQDDLRFLRTVDEGDIDIVSRSLDDRRWIAAFADDDRPTRFYLYEPEARRATLLFSSHSALDAAPLARMRSVEIKARDGLELVGYLTLPRELDRGGLNDIVPTQPAPMVLTVHSGPWARDSWGFNHLHQFLANRGYAALSVNYRGSTGFGKAFVNAGDREWGGKMQDDLVDAVRWAIDAGVADPKRVAIMGASYGGYAALLGASRDGPLFAASIDMFGPANLVSLLESIPKRWGAIIEVYKRRIGDFTTPEGREFLLSRSPVSRLADIATPLLIAQGAHDRRTPRAGTDALVETLRRNGAPVAYTVFLDEGHGLTQPQNRLAFHAIVEAFLGKWLGGRVEPMGDALRGASIEVVGAENAPGLREALPPPK